MSIHKSYFNKSNTIVYNSYTNTARNPIVELFFGKVDNIQIPKGFSRYIFDVDLTLLQSKIADGVISDDCGIGLKHTLRMKNTSAFDQELINDTTSTGRRRATSFDLVLFRIPKVGGQSQTWDTGVGYDYYDFTVKIETDKSFSQRPSNWYQRSTILDWSTDGVYDNLNSQTGTGINYSALTIVDTQHFEFGDEDIEFDMTNEINSLLSGGTTGLTGWGVAFIPQLENITGLTENYSVGFFSPHTQTFYEPYLETEYYDLILDDRNAFYCENDNNLYLYVYEEGVPINFDSNPTVDIIDSNGDAVAGFTNLPTCLITEGVYKVEVNNMPCTDAPCLYFDVWKGLSINGIPLDDQENEFALLVKKGKYTVGSTTETPSIYGFEFNGVKQNEKVLNNDVRKVNVTIKKAFTSNEVLNRVQAFYRIYVREGANTEVQVQDWTRISRTPDGHYFVFDTRDKIPNEYFVDIKVRTDRNIETFKRELQFMVVNKK